MWVVDVGGWVSSSSSSSGWQPFLSVCVYVMNTLSHIHLDGPPDASFSAPQSNDTDGGQEIRGDSQHGGCVQSTCIHTLPQRERKGEGGGGGGDACVCLRMYESTRTAFPHAFPLPPLSQTGVARSTWA